MSKSPSFRVSRNVENHLTPDEIQRFATESIAAYQMEQDSMPKGALYRSAIRVCPIRGKEIATHTTFVHGQEWEIFMGTREEIEELVKDQQERDQVSNN